MAFDVPASFKSYKVYKDLMCGVLGMDSNQEIATAHVKIVSDLRYVLIKATKDNVMGEGGKEINNGNDNDVNEDDDSDVVHKFEYLQMAIHYTHMLNVCSRNRLDGLSAKISITLLQYSTVIPADKLFYIAGHHCREANHTNLAFLLLNRFVDLMEVSSDAYF